MGGVTATAPSRDLTDNKKKEEGGLKQRRKQEEAAQGDPEPRKGNQEKEKDPRRVLSRGSAGRKTQKKTKRMEGDAKHTKTGGRRTELQLLRQKRQAQKHGKERLTRPKNPVDGRLLTARIPSPPKTPHTSY